MEIEAAVDEADVSGMFAPDTSTFHDAPEGRPFSLKVTGKTAR